MCVSLNSARLLPVLPMGTPVFSCGFLPSIDCMHEPFTPHMYRASSLILEVSECASPRAFRQQLCLPGKEIDGYLFVQEQTE